MGIPNWNGTCILLLMYPSTSYGSFHSRNISTQHILNPSSSEIDALLGLLALTADAKGVLERLHLTQGVFNSISNPSTAISDAQGKNSRNLFFFLLQLVILFGTETDKGSRRLG